MSPPAAVPAGAPAPRQSVAARLRQLLILYAVLGLSAITVLLLSFDALSARRELSQQLQSLAQLTAASVSAAVAFRDPYVARDTLTNLALLPQIERACLYLHEQGRTELLADFARPTAPPCPPETTASRGPTRVDKRWAQWTAVTPVVVGQQTVGTLLLGRQLDDLWRVLGWRLLLGATAVGLGLLLALWAARVLQSRTVQPMLDLAQVARKVSESEDFTLRAAEPPQRDEVHALVEDFNAMLQQIESREQALLYTNHRLEDEIIERAPGRREPAGRAAKGPKRPGGGAAHPGAADRGREDGLAGRAGRWRGPRGQQPGGASASPPPRSSRTMSRRCRA